MDPLTLGYAKINMEHVETYDELRCTLFTKIGPADMPEAAVDDDMIGLLQHVISEWGILTMESQPGWVKTDSELLLLGQDAHHLQHTDVAGIIPRDMLSKLQQALSDATDIRMTTVSIKNTPASIARILALGAYTSSWDIVRTGAGTLQLEPQCQ